MKNIGALLSWGLVFWLSATSIDAQKNFLSDFVVQLDLGWGLTLHHDEPIYFSEPFSDASFIPQEQSTEFGEILLFEVLYEWTDHLEAGLCFGYHAFQFLERGDRIFMGIPIGPYSFERSFRIWNIGLSAQYQLLEFNDDRITLGARINYGNLIDDEDGQWTIEHYGQKSKFSGGLIIRYGHRLTDRVNLQGGIYATSAINDYFERVEYKPYAYGLSVRVRYEVE